jgi:hypothetical protein
MEKQVLESLDLKGPERLQFPGAEVEVLHRSKI